MISYTKHALQRLSERKIEKEVVENVVESPDYTLEVKAKRKVAIKKIGSRYLKVVYVVESSIVVLTILWLTRLRSKDKLL